MIGVERINLLPGFVAARRRARRVLQASTLAASAAAVACGVTYLSQGFALRDARSELAVQAAENAAIQVEVDRLADLEANQAVLVEAQSTLETLFADEIRWSVVLADLQAVMPGDTWLTGMQVAMADVDRGVATILFQGTTFRHTDVADWLQRLDRVPSFTDAYFSVSTKQDVGGQEMVAFSSSVTVTDVAFRRSTPGAAR